MFTKTIQKLAFSVVLTFLAGILTFEDATLVQAQSYSQDQGSQCISCHENQYYLYDAGRWYCISEAKDRCVNCHGGNSESLDKQEAHIGIIGNPLDHGEGPCESCHTQDAEALANEVISYTGNHLAKLIAPYQVIEPMSDSFPEQYQSTREKQGEEWFVPSAIAVAVLFFAFLYGPKWL